MEKVVEEKLKEFVELFREKGKEYGQPVAVAVEEGSRGRVVLGKLKSGNYRLKRKEEPLDGLSLGVLTFVGVLTNGKETFPAVVLLPAKRKVVEELLKNGKFVVKTDEGATVEGSLLEVDAKLLKAAQRIVDDFLSALKKNAH